MRQTMKPLLGLALAGCVVALSQAPAAARDDANQLSPRAQAALGDARRATARFHDINVALSASGGYGPTPVMDVAGNICIDQPGQGAMGIHYANGSLLDATVKEEEPEALMYEPMPNGTLRLVGVEYLVFQDVWDQANPGRPPRLFDQAFHLVPAGNRYGLPRFYALHVWMWQPNRNGLFADWNPAVRCP